jgi:threonine dehydratase
MTVMSEVLSVPALVTRENIARAARELASVAIRTPLLQSQWLSDELGADVRLKCENLQRAGAFKVRGAYTAIARLSPESRRRGVVAFSSGNHGQGVALAAKLFGIRAVVVMPTTVSDVKRLGVLKLGAEAVLEGTTSVERQRRAEQIAATEGLTIVPAFDDDDIIAGQGTAGLEIVEEWPDVQAILVPVGGGGLLSGVAAYVKQTNPEIRVIGVEPESADAMKQSLDAGSPVTIPPARTIADGLMPVRPGDRNYAHARAFVDDIVRVGDDAILEATRRLMSESKLVVEFSGAATVAALISGAFDARGLRVAAVLSGGNIDARRALELMSA